MSEAMKRLTLRVPPDHPIFAVEPGQRNKVVLEWLDIGQRLAEIEKVLKNGTQIIQAEPANTSTLTDKQEFLSYFE